ncbi:MAG: hypothetical protein VKJ86_11770 [Synechococcus sp.]|nr:hypothetical protein [Synechococcus sp.]
MNKFESKPSQLKLDTNEGWVVQVYDSNRRLLCVLEPSHGWSFLIGCSLGLLVSVMWFSAARHSPSPEPAPATEPAILQVD